MADITMSKILTVVVPTYNMEPYLDHCLSSFIMPEHYMAMIEILVINDGSKDGSSDIGHNYSAKYPDIYRVIDKPNGNYGSCINVGLAEATGKYFRILDADDWYDSNALMAFLDVLSSCDADLVISPFNFIAEKTTLFTFSNKLETNRPLPIDSICSDDIIHRMHSMTYRLDVLRKSGIRLSEGVSYTDTEFCFYPLPFVEMVQFIDETVYQYNAQREGQTCSPDSMVRSTNSMYVVTKRLLQSYLKGNIDAHTVAGEIQLQLLIQITQMYYETSLLFCNSEDDPHLKEVDELVRCVPVLDAILDKRRRHSVHYVRMWRRSGKRYSCNLLCQLHDSIWERKRKSI